MLKRRDAQALALVAVAHVALAQTGMIVGSVARDSMGHAIAGAEVRLAGAPRSTTTNYLGEFRVDGLAPGKYVITVRSIGFRPLTDSVDIVGGRVAEREFILAEAPRELDTVRTSAPEQKYRSAMLNAVEERRLSHQGGQFLSDSMLRRLENEKVVDVLNRIGGLITFQKGPGAFVASGRSVGDGGMALKSPAPGVPSRRHVMSRFSSTA